MPRLIPRTFVPVRAAAAALAFDGTLLTLVGVLVSGTDGAARHVTVAIAALVLTHLVAISCAQAFIARSAISGFASLDRPDSHLAPSRVTSYIAGIAWTFASIATLVLILATHATARRNATSEGNELAGWAATIFLAPAVAVIDGVAPRKASRRSAELVEYVWLGAGASIMRVYAVAAVLLAVSLPAGVAAELVWGAPAGVLAASVWFMGTHTITGAIFAAWRARVYLVATGTLPPVKRPEARSL